MIEPIHQYCEHTMGSSLERYIKMKMHHFIDTVEFEKVSIVPLYDRKSEPSKNEKNGKLFNWQRPTAKIVNKELIIECFPGYDYVRHYYSLIKTYLYHTNRKKIEVTFIEPKVELIEQAILNTNILNFKYPEIVILGTVEELHPLTNTDWKGDGPFKMSKSGNLALVGCEFSFWGDISKYVSKHIVKKGQTR